MQVINSGINNGAENITANVKNLIAFKIYAATPITFFILQKYLVDTYALHLVFFHSLLHNHERVYINFRYKLRQECLIRGLHYFSVGPLALSRSVFGAYGDHVTKPASGRARKKLTNMFVSK